MELVREKYRTALLVAAVEEYMRLHPYGVDYRELEKIRKGSYHSFQPKGPFRRICRRRPVRKRQRSPLNP